MKLLLSSSSSSGVHFVDESGITALHMASIYGNPDCALALMAAGARVEAEDDDKQTPLFFALSFGHSITAGVLLAAGADLCKRDKFGATGE